jgi:chemotaxis protein methyltransferase CheR
MPPAESKFPEDLRERLKSHISQRCGLYFRDHDLRNLESAVERRMRALGIESGHAYYLHLTGSDGREGEFRELLNLLTVNHTYFFRNEPQFMALKEKVLPELAEDLRRRWFEGGRSGRPALRIWSAGCSTGEEPYTLAMVLRDTPCCGDFDIDIYATDASTEALEKARLGVYGESSMRLVSEPCRGLYFSEGPSGWRLCEEIKSMVRFGYHNLVADPFPAGIDVVFCRNVTIYFDPATTRRITDAFHSSLADGGYLFLGYSESLTSSRKFQMVCRQDAIFFRKDSGPPPLPAPAPPAPASAEPGPEDFDALRSRILDKISRKDYGAALDLIETVREEGPRMLEVHYLAAGVCANMNRLEEAKARIRRALSLDSLFAPAYYLLGFIHQEENRAAHARESFQKALFIDPGFLMARFSLAHLLRGEGKVSEAIREYRNTLALLSRGPVGPRDEGILQAMGFSAATLRSVCCDNLERLRNEP